MPASARGCRGRRARCPTRSATEPMIPSVGSRVSIRHRLPTGEFTDVIGHLLALTPNVVVRSKSGELVEISRDDVVAMRKKLDEEVAKDKKRKKKRGGNP